MSDIGAAQIDLCMWRISQFSIKVVVALAMKGLLPEKHYRCVSAPDPRSKKFLESLPHPQTIPVLKWRENGTQEVVIGSDNICAFLDERIPSPSLYPANPDAAAIVRELEQRIAKMYWANGMLSLGEKESFERFSGDVARKYARDNVFGAKFLLAAVPKLSNMLIFNAVEKDWRKMLVRRGSPLAKERDAAKVLRETREELARLDALLAASPTTFFGSSPTATAADLTLYCMLERWVGNCLQPGVHGAAQPQILEGMPAIQQMWDELSGQFHPLINLSTLEDYEDITDFFGDVTWPRTTDDKTPAPPPVRQEAEAVAATATAAYESVPPPVEAPARGK